MVIEILIVDDEPNVVVPIQFLMEQQGYRVMIAEKGEDPGIGAPRQAMRPTVSH